MNLSLNDLVATWRADSETCKVAGCTMCNGVLKCADELEAALAASGTLTDEAIVVDRKALFEIVLSLCRFNWAHRMGDAELRERAEQEITKIARSQIIASSTEPTREQILGVLDDVLIARDVERRYRPSPFRTGVMEGMKNARDIVLALFRSEAKP